MRRYALRDDQWERIKDFLPGREGHVGGTAADNRLFVEAVLYRYRAGIPWRDLPERFGDWKIVHQRFGRWAKSGVFERIFKLLASDHDNEYSCFIAPDCEKAIQATRAILKSATKQCEKPHARRIVGAHLFLASHGDRHAVRATKRLADPPVWAGTPMHVWSDPWESELNCAKRSGAMPTAGSAPF